jgi:FixJ family two-component response regulator
MGSSADQIIAVVDDDERVCRSMRNLFLSLEFAVEAFGSAEAFLQSGRLEDTACLILDLRMPGMGGLDLLHALSAAGTEVPTIVLTAHGDADTRVSCLQAGALAVLQKPFDTGVLAQSVKTIMGSARGARSGNPSFGSDF